MMKINLNFINMTQKVNQKVKQKTNIKININLSDKRKRKRVRRKRTSTGNNLTTAQLLLARQPTVINNTRTLPENASGNILDVIRNQQSQIDKHSTLINTGVSQLNFLNNQLRNYQPVKTEETSQQQEAQQEEDEPEEDDVYIKRTPNKAVNKKGRRVNISDLSKKLYGDTTLENRERAFELVNENYREKTLEELQDEYRTKMRQEPDGRWGATKLIVALSGMDNAISSGRVSTARGGGAQGGGSPIFSPPIEPPQLSDQIEEASPPDPMSSLLSDDN